MSSATTTLKLPDSLKTRIANAAEAAGITFHTFMVEALHVQTELAEKRREFVNAAILAEQEVAQYGLVYDADEVFSYMRAKLEGRTVESPTPAKL